MFARFFGGSAPEAADVASAKDEGGGSNAAEGETPQDQGVANQISKMDSIIRWVRYLACSFVAWWVSS